MSFNRKATECTPKEFNSRFNELRGKHPDKTYLDVYFLVEKEHIDSFGRTKYASYDSFRVVRSRKIKEYAND